MKHKINVLDPTIREVGFINNWTFTLEQVQELVLKSEAAGVKWVEIGHGNGLGNPGMKFTHEEYLAAAKKVLTKAKLSLFSLSGLCTPAMIKSTVAAGLECIRIGFAGFNSEFPLSGVRILAEAAKELGIRVSVNMLEAGRYNEADLKKIMKELRSIPLDMLYIVDSPGAMLPAQVSAQVKFLQDNIDCEIGFHGHQQLNMANTNSIAAVEAGALWIDGTMLGAGRPPGNAQLEVVSAILKKMGYETEVDWVKLSQSAGEVLKPLLPGNTALSLDQIALGYYGVMDFAKDWVREAAAANKVDRFKLMEQIDKNRVQCITKEDINKALKQIK
jgi:4-hydroxy 2-oxovalerate aldolase